MVTGLVSFCQLDTNSVIQEEDTSFERMPLSGCPVDKSVGTFSLFFCPFLYAHVCAQCECLVSTKDRKGVHPLKLEVKHSCDPPCGCWESNSSSLGEQVLLIVDLSLHSLWGIFLFNDWCGKNQEVSWARRGEQASRQHYSLASASATASRVMTFLSSRHDFSQ